MAARRAFDLADALEVSNALGIDLAAEEFALEDFRAGMNVELEHGTRDPATNVTGDDPLVTGKIALAHLREMPDYYQRLARMEAAAESEADPG
jgi:hypothetical protein